MQYNVVPSLAFHNPDFHLTKLEAGRQYVVGELSSNDRMTAGQLVCTLCTLCNICTLCTVLTLCTLWPIFCQMCTLRTGGAPALGSGWLLELINRSAAAFGTVVYCVYCMDCENCVYCVYFMDCEHCVYCVYCMDCAEFYVSYKLSGFNTVRVLVYIYAVSPDKSMGKSLSW